MREVGLMDDLTREFLTSPSSTKSFFCANLDPLKEGIEIGGVKSQFYVVLIGIAGLPVLE